MTLGGPRFEGGQYHADTCRTHALYVKLYYQARLAAQRIFTAALRVLKAVPRSQHDHQTEALGVKKEEETCGGWIRPGLDLYPPASD